MTELVLEGMTALPKSKRDIEEGNIWYKDNEQINGYTLYIDYSTGYRYLIGKIQNKTFLLDNFSVNQFIISSAEIDENNFLESLEGVYKNAFNQKVEQSVLTKDRLIEIIKIAKLEDVEQAVTDIENLFKELVKVGEVEEE